MKDVNVIDRWPLNLSDLPKQKDIRKFKHLQFIDLKDRPNDIGLLLGNNEPELVKPLEAVSGSDGEPYAVKYSLGWSICGPLFGSNSSENVNSKISCHEVNVESLSSIEESLYRFYRQDFEDPNFDSKGLLQMDKLWFSKVESSIVKTGDSRYQIDLPFKNDDPSMPNNYGQALGNLNSLERRFEKDPIYEKD